MRPPRDTQRTKVYRFEDTLKWFSLVDSFAEEYDLLLDIQAGPSSQELRIHHPTATQVMPAGPLARYIPADYDATKPEILLETHWLNVGCWMNEMDLSNQWSRHVAHSGWTAMLDEQEVRFYISYLWSKYAEPEWQQPSVNFRGSSTAGYSVSSNEIMMAPFAQTRRIIIHEFAHYCIDWTRRREQVQIHGPEFVNTLLNMLESELGADPVWARSLAAKRGVKCSG